MIAIIDGFLFYASNTKFAKIDLNTEETYKINSNWTCEGVWFFMSKLMLLVKTQEFYNADMDFTVTYQILLKEVENGFMKLVQSVLVKQNAQLKMKWG